MFYHICMLLMLHDYLACKHGESKPIFLSNHERILFYNYQNRAMWNIFLFNIINVIMLYPEKFILKVVSRVIMDIILILCYAVLLIKFLKDFLSIIIKMFNSMRNLCIFFLLFSF